MVIIYKIYSEKGPKVYVGSTSVLLCNRKSVHIYDYKNKITRRCSSYILFDEYGIENCIFEILEECKKEEKLSKERYWIDISENCVNKNRPVITKEEKDQYNKEYRLIKQKECPETNRAYTKKYLIKLKETNPELYEERRIINNEKRNEVRKELIICECGIEIKTGSKFKHLKSKKHLELLKTGVACCS